MESKSKHIGSDFDSFLKEEGLLEISEAVAAKRIFVFEIEQVLMRKKISKAQLAEKMGTSRSAVDRLLNPNMPSTLKTLCDAARALGKRVELHIA